MSGSGYGANPRFRAPLSVDGEGLWTLGRLVRGWCVFAGRGVWSFAVAERLGQDDKLAPALLGK